jgi:type I restriction enzyme, S subunit
MASVMTSQHEIVTLESVSEKIDYGLTTSATSSDTGIKFLRITDIQDNGVDWQSVPFCECSEKDLIQYSLAKGDIVFARTGATTGKSYLINETPEKTVFASYLIRVRADKNIVDPEFLSYFFQTPQYWQQISDTAVGAAQVGVNGSKLAELRMPLPPLTEQKRIASLLARADRLRQLRRTAHDLSDSVLQSVFLEMFGKPEENPKGFDVFELGEIGTLDRGRSKNRPRNAPELYGGKYPFIQTGDITNAGSYIKSYQQTYSELGLKQSKMWKTGTLAITIAANIAKTAILTFDACFPDSVVGFVPNKEKTNVEYVQYWLSFKQKELEDNAPESAQKNINLEILRGLAIPVPSLSLQEEFAGVVARVEGLRGRMGESTRQVEGLFESLLAEAFDR